jgi:hypothetical protein
MEITYLDPSTYMSLESHEIRQTILTTLFKAAYNGKELTKQELADILDVKYQQLVYQLNNHLADFWKVVREEKVRGTRMEYIMPTEQNGIYIAMGKDRRIYIVDPIAEIYGPLGTKGCRCDVCSEEESEYCVKSLIEKGVIPEELSDAEKETLEINGRKELRPLDRGIIKALSGIAAGDKCVLTIPCERCTFLMKKNLIEIC